MKSWNTAWKFTWVVFPDPVSPETNVTWLASIDCSIWSLYLTIGRVCLNISRSDSPRLGGTCGTPLFNLPVAVLASSLETARKVQKKIKNQSTDKADGKCCPKLYRSLLALFSEKNPLGCLEGLQLWLHFLSNGVDLACYSRVFIFIHQYCTQYD